jgi:hypothetical protein
LVFYASSVPDHGTPFGYACGSNDGLGVSGNQSSSYSPSVADVEPVDVILERSPDHHRFSLADSGKYNGSSSLSDKPVVHSTRVGQLRILPTRAALLALKFFFDNILKHFMF